MSLLSWKERVYSSTYKMFNISAENENKQHSFDLYCRAVWWSLIAVYLNIPCKQPFLWEGCTQQQQW